jgi:hypothetical protein
VPTLSTCEVVLWAIRCMEHMILPPKDLQLLLLLPELRQTSRSGMSSDRAWLRHALHTMHATKRSCTDKCCSTSLQTPGGSSLLLLPSAGTVKDGSDGSMNAVKQTSHMRR